MLGLPVLNCLEKAGLRFWNTLAPLRAKVLPMDSLPKALIAGLLWGFLPCGLVYGALGVALGLASDSQVGIDSNNLYGIFLAWYFTHATCHRRSHRLAKIQNPRI